MKKKKTKLRTKIKSKILKEALVRSFYSLKDYAYLKLVRIDGKKLN